MYHYLNGAIIMILTYKDCINKYGSDYLIKKEIVEERLYQKEKGIYSTTKACSELEIISTKYPKAIFTGESAFYYHGLTDAIPDFYHLATLRTNTRIKDKRVEQSFLTEELFAVGKSQLQYHNITINIYNLERMLIELVRFKNKLPFDYYTEIISSYRNKVETMDISKVEEYAEYFHLTEKWMNIIQMEVL